MQAPMFLTTLLASLVLASSGEPRHVVPWVGGYEFIAGRVTWTSADAACTALGWHLAMPQTAAEGAILQQLLIEHGAAQAHIGFHDLFVENEYFTVLGQSLAQVGFQQGALSVNDDADCGSLGANGFRSVVCNVTLPAICQRPAGADYDLVAGFGYYKLSAQQMSWTDAVLACRTEGADLLVLHSDDEYMAVMSKYHIMNDGYYVHYGAHHAFADQRFVTLFGEPLEQSGFALWAEFSTPGTNVDRPYLALAIYNSWRDKGLYLMGATFSARFICKRPLHA